MADPLSIAGSVVGITAAGVQASVKLYALAEKVATASQRVTSIADDVTVLGQKFCNAKLPKRRTTILGNAVLGG